MFGDNLFLEDPWGLKETLSGGFSRGSFFTNSTWLQAAFA